MKRSFYKPISYLSNTMKFTAILRKGEKQYVALCPEIDVVSQGYTKSEAIFNLNKAVELYLEVKYE